MAGPGFYHDAGASGHGPGRRIQQQHDRLAIATIELTRIGMSVVEPPSSEHLADRSVAASPGHGERPPRDRRRITRPHHPRGTGGGMIKVGYAMSTSRFHLVGISHIDLAWLHDSHEYAEYMESTLVRMLDLLDQHNTFTYTIEQIAHYRALSQRRPDLVARLKGYVEQGRVELIGAMASTADTNGPNGECLVRNLLIGRQWAREHLGAVAETGDLIDTFGVCAQMPQILRQFGMTHLVANRLGGEHKPEIFRARGLDGSEVVVIGGDVHAPDVPRQRVHWRMVRSHDRIDALLDSAATSQANGAQLVVVYDENERVPSIRSAAWLEQLDDARRSQWAYGTFGSFIRALGAESNNSPVLDADLNPAFTGTFGLRPTIRVRNRRIENLLLEAEKAATLAGLNDPAGELEDAWWLMAYVHSHDVYTGSMPSKVYREAMRWLDQVEHTAGTVLDRALGLSRDASADQAEIPVRVFNGLPWARKEIAAVTLPSGWAGVQRVQQDGQAVPFEVVAGQVRFLADAPPVGSSRCVLTAGSAPEPKQPVRVDQAVIENDHLRIECTPSGGIERIVCKRSGQPIVLGAGGLLSVQHDVGAFQIADPIRGELPATAGSIELARPERTPLGQRLVMAGVFPTLAWAGQEHAEAEVAIGLDPASAARRVRGNHLHWRLVLTLLDDVPRLDLAVELDWRGEASRIRLHLPTTVDSSRGIYEIPFGLVHRRPYRVRHTCAGEWPAHRFVAVEDPARGVALINRGAHGVEVMDGDIATTLLRAPAIERTGMRPDDTSSQHGRHRFDFAVVAYAGPSSRPEVIRQAQAVNSPLHAGFIKISSPHALDTSAMSLEPAQCVLAAVKVPLDGPEQEIVVRIYEATGASCTARLRCPGVREAWHCDLLEAKRSTLPHAGGTLEVPMRPFEIKTLRLSLAGPR